MAMELEDVFQQEQLEELDVPNDTKILFQNAVSIPWIMTLSQDLNLPKDSQYKLIRVLRKIFHQVPNYIQHPLRKNIELGCLKIILQDSQLQNFLNHPTLQNQLNEITPEFLIELRPRFYQIQTLFENNFSNPYEILEILQEVEMMSAKVRNIVKSVLDLSMLYHEAYSVSPDELLYICMEICNSFDNSIQPHLNWFDKPILGLLNEFRLLINDRIFETMQQVGI